MALSDYSARKHAIETNSETLNDACDELENDLQAQFADLPNTRRIALRLLDGNARIERALRSGKLLALVKRKRNKTAVQRHKS